MIQQCSDVISFQEDASRRSVGHPISTSDVNSAIDWDGGSPRDCNALQNGDNKDARQLLRGPLLEYIVWLREHRENLVRMCRVAEVCKIAFL